MSIKNPHAEGFYFYCILRALILWYERYESTRRIIQTTGSMRADPGPITIQRLIKAQRKSIPKPA